MAWRLRHSLPPDVGGSKWSRAPKSLELVVSVSIQPVRPGEGRPHNSGSLDDERTKLQTIVRGRAAGAQRLQDERGIG